MKLKVLKRLQQKKKRFYAQDSTVATNNQFTGYECQSQYYCLKENLKEKSGRIMFGSYRISGPDE